jgi:Family of unknown function (DUF5678)
MSDTEIMPAPEFSSLRVPSSKWRDEFNAFQRLLPSLLATHAGKYVAIHNGQVVDTGDDQAEVAMRAYAKFGYVPMHVGLVTIEPRPIMRISSPRHPAASE